MNILLIIPEFFGYENKIKLELERKGYNCDIIYENMKERSIFYRYLIRCMPNKEKDIFDLYYKQKLKKRIYQKVLIIRGSTITKKTIELIRNNSPKVKIYMYQWDSVKNNPNAEIIAADSDFVATFDDVDSISYGWKYLPLFYINESFRTNKRDIDISYICTLHSQRVKVYKYLLDNFENKRKFLYLFSQPTHYIKQKYLYKSSDFSDINSSFIKYCSLDLDKVQEIMSKTNIVVDYTHPEQSGFTMRTIESVGHRCKLLTNNKNIKHADFYHPNNVCIYSLDNIIISDEFMNSDYVLLEDAIYNKYSLEKWLDVILDNV